MEALRQPGNRLKGFLPLPGGASRAKRSANPHRIKARAHRHRTRTTGYRVYANDNPVRFIDPDGRSGKVAWLVRLGVKGMTKIARLTREQAIRSRRAGQNIVGDKRQISRTNGDQWGQSH